jgi:hypothetical protein
VIHRRKPSRCCLCRSFVHGSHVCLSHARALLLCGKHADVHRRRGCLVGTATELHAAYHRLHRRHRPTRET